MNTELPTFVILALEDARKFSERRLCAIRMYGQRWHYRIPACEIDERRDVAKRLRRILSEIGPRERSIVRRAHREMKAGAR